MSERKMEQEWFEMAEIRRRQYERAVWIPLLASCRDLLSGQTGKVGYREEFFGIGHISVPIDQMGNTEKLGWSEIGIRHTQSGWVDDGTYTPANVFHHYGDTVTGEYLAMRQHFNSVEPDEWHLGQDVMLTLGLRREGDVWVRPNEGYMEVARLSRNEEGYPKILEIRATHLRDYLCGRGMALYLTSYRSRTEIMAFSDHIKWDGEHIRNATEMERWEGTIRAIHEGGMGYGEKVAVFHVSRTDVDPEEDIPSMDFPSNENVRSQSWTRNFSGRKLYRVTGELWKNEWVNPASTSPIVRGDETSPIVFFITDAEGRQESKETLIDGEGKWLWFRPDVIPTLAHRRGGSLSWYTRDTGNVTCSPDHGVHFGVNSLGLVNVYAKDIGLLPDWQQKIWAGYNVSPEGKVSRELLASQVEAEPAATQAPEAFLSRGLELLNNLSSKIFGVAFVKDHEKTLEIIKHAHRFRSTDQNGLFALAKDLARLTADSFDLNAMQSVTKPPKGTTWGSLKTLENVVATKVGADAARQILGPLVGIYQLRLADAHMPSKDMAEALSLARVETEAPYVMQGFQILSACVSCIYNVCNAIESSEARESKAGTQ